MKKRKNIITALLLASAMLFTTGCGSTGSTDKSSEDTAPVSAEASDESGTTESTEASKEETKEEPKEIVNITMMVYDRGHEYGAGYSLTDNKLIDWINSEVEPLGVHVDLIPVPRSGSDNEINLMLASGEAPDIIRTYDRQRVATYASQGGILDLTEYMDYLSEEYRAHTDAIEFCQFEGGQYALPGIYAYHGKSHETFLRQDLVEGMQMEMPTNREELIDVLYAMKDKYPDIIPYGFGGKITNGNYTNWLLSYTSRANERDNYIYEPTFTIVLKPGHKEGLKQLNQFVLDGIIDPDFALDTDNTEYDQNIANGKYGFVMDGDDSCIDEAYESSGIEGYHMVSVDCIENVDGSYEVPSQGAIDFYTYVPATAADRIEAVMTFLGWLSVEDNQFKVSNGGENIGFTYNEDGSAKAFSREERAANGSNTNPSDLNFLYSTYAVNEKSLTANYAQKNPELPMEVAEGKIKSQYSNYYDACVIGGALKSDEYVPLLQTLIVEFVFKCMNAPEGQFDAVYEKEYQILLDNHLQEVLDERAAWYDANIAK